MDKLLSSLSSYQLLSSTIPGVSLLILLREMCAVTAVPDDVGALLVLGYASGLALNRVGAFLLDGIAPKDMLALFVLYESRPAAQQVYDTLVMYRTFVIAALCALVALRFGGVPEGHLNKPATYVILWAVLAAFFYGWWRQRLYVFGVLYGGNRNAMMRARGRGHWLLDRVRQPPEQV